MNRASAVHPSGLDWPSEARAAPPDVSRGSTAADSGDADGDGAPDLLIGLGEFASTDVHGGHLYWLAGGELLEAE